MNKEDFKKGDYVKFRTSTGTVTGVYWNEDKSDGIIEIMFVKNLFQRGIPELHKFSIVGEYLEHATEKEVKTEIVKKLYELRKKVKETFNADIFKAAQTAKLD